MGGEPEGRTAASRDPRWPTRAFPGMGGFRLSLSGPCVPFPCCAGNSVPGPRRPTIPSTADVEKRNKFGLKRVEQDLGPVEGDPVLLTGGPDPVSGERALVPSEGQVWSRRLAPCRKILPQSIPGQNDTVTNPEGGFYTLPIHSKIKLISLICKKIWISSKSCE